MTIALGILTADGVVIAADTQEGTGYAGDTKASGRKIFTRLDPTEQRAISITGAGSSDYLDTLSQDIAEKFREATDYPDAEKRIKDYCAQFYKDLVLPLHVLPREEQPTVEPLIGFTWGTSTGLLMARQMVVPQSREYAAVGAGRQHARMLMDRIFPLRYDLPSELAAYFAAYVIFHVKQFVEGCGKGTHVTILRQGQGHYISEWAIAELERCFADQLDLEGSMVNYVLGRQLSRMQNAPANMIRQLQTIKKRISRLTPPPADFDLDWADTPRVARTTDVLQEIKGRAIFKR